jgi:hypothetical protein
MAPFLVEEYSYGTLSLIWLYNNTELFKLSSEDKNVYQNELKKL